MPITPPSQAAPPPTLELTPENSWLGGFAESKFFGKPASYDPASVGIDIFATIGRLQAGFSPSNPTNQSAVTDAIQWFSNYISSTQKMYGYSTGGKLYEIDVSTNTVTNNGTFPRTIATSRGQGLEVFAGKLWYASNGQLNTYDFASTFTEPVSGHTGLNTSVNGNNILTPLRTFELTGRLYIGNGNKVYSTDGTTMATSSSYTLTFPTGTVVEDIWPIGQFLYLAIDQGRGNTAYRGKAKMAVWDGLTPDVPNAIYDFPDNAFTRIINNGNEVYGFGGRGFYRWLGNTYSGGNEWQLIYPTNGEVIAGMVDAFRGFVNFQDNASIFGFGTPRSLSIPKVLYSPYTGVGNSGAIRWVSNSSLYVARSTSPFLVYLSSGATTGVTWLNKMVTFPFQMIVKQVQIFTETLVSGDAITVLIADENGTQTSLTDNAGNTGFSFATDGANNTKSFFPTNNPFASLQIGIGFTSGAVKVKKVYVWLEPYDILSTN